MDFIIQIAIEKKEEKRTRERERQRKIAPFWVNEMAYIYIIIRFIYIEIEKDMNYEFISTVSVCKCVCVKKNGKKARPLVKEMNDFFIFNIHFIGHFGKKVSKF